MGGDIIVLLFGGFVAYQLTRITINNYKDLRKK